MEEAIKKGGCGCIITDKVLDGMMEFRRYHGGDDPTGIIVHEEGWYKIVEDLLGINSPYIDHYTFLSDPKIRGIKVYRTSDIRYDEFKIF